MGLCIDPAKRCTCNSGLPCSPCPIPKQNLTLCWFNVLIGNGSTPLNFTPPGQWNSACFNQLLAQLNCAGSSVYFGVIYFISGACPSGQSQTCDDEGIGAGGTISLVDYTCSPFLLHFRVLSTGCPVLWSDGYTDFVVTEGSCPYSP